VDGVEWPTQALVATTGSVCNKNFLRLLGSLAFARLFSFSSSGRSAYLLVARLWEATDVEPVTHGEPASIKFYFIFHHSNQKLFGLPS